MATQQTMDQIFPQTKPKFQTVNSFYGKKDISPLKESAIFNARQKKIYRPTVKKMITFSSDDESDSDSEFISCKKIVPEDENENCDVSPSKIRRIETDLTCSKGTPRNSKVNGTPSVHLAELNLSPKKTGPRKKLFADKYQDARLALHSSVPEKLVCREIETNNLLTFIKDHISKKTSGSLYISGPPGTGKTAALTKVTALLPKSLVQVYINCTSLKSPQAIYTKICDELKLPVELKRESKATVEKFFASMSRRRSILLVLDEIDNLEIKTQSVLYSIFEWPSFPNSKLILIGIANALDLTDRILPRLQARCEIKPKLLHFPPYTNEQIISIITSRLEQANMTEIFTQNALNLLAKKVSSISGDIRKTLDVCRRLFEYAEAERNSVILLNGIKTEKAEELVKVDVKEVLSIMNMIYGGSQNFEEAQSKFPLQQKLLLCSLMLLLNKGKNKDVTIGRLYMVYKKVCQKRNLSYVDNSEFVSLCSLIETRGIIRIGTKRDAQLSKIYLEWELDYLNASLKDKNLTSNIINDVSCL